MQLSRGAFTALGRPKHVVVVRRITKRRYAPYGQELRIIAAVQEVHVSQLEEDHARLDQILRYVLGLEIHERAHVFSVEVPGSVVRLVPPRRYVLLRVQVADINIVEQQACLMPQDELDLLGISYGDVVVLEACLPRDSEVALSYEVRLYGWKLMQSLRSCWRNERVTRGDSPFDSPGFRTERQFRIGALFDVAAQA